MCNLKTLKPREGEANATACTSTGNDDGRMVLPTMRGVNKRKKMTNDVRRNFH